VSHRFFHRAAVCRLPVAAVALLLASACSGGGDVTDPLPVTRISFTTASDTVDVQSTRQLAALLRDGQGNVVDGATMRWSSSDAQVATVSTSGLARGVQTGATTITASSGGSVASIRLVVREAAAVVVPEQPSTIPAPAVPSSYGDGSFSIRIAWAGAADARASSLIDAAVARWRRVVTGDLPNATFDIQADACYEGQPASRETVDDLLIVVRVLAIDGAAGTLARAGPCLVRSNRGLPLVGLVELDEADLSRDPAVVQTVLTHEIGHVLGIGTLWERAGLLHGKDSDNPLFLGATAQSAYQALGGGSALVLVENTGGEGTKNGHWRESSYRTELMTGWIGSGSNPLSTITVGSLRDLGYAVSMAAADGFVMPSANVASPSIAGGTGLKLVDELIRPTFTVDEDGRTRRLPGR
jgi:hypothetical protein